jgi:hypothetical protein
VKQKDNTSLNESPDTENKIIESNSLVADTLNKLNPASKNPGSQTGKKT